MTNKTTAKYNKLSALMRKIIGARMDAEDLSSVIAKTREIISRKTISPK